MRAAARARGPGSGAGPRFVHRGFPARRRHASLRSQSVRKEIRCQEDSMPFPLSLSPRLPEHQAFIKLSKPKPSRTQRGRRAAGAGAEEEQRRPARSPPPPPRPPRQEGRNAPGSLVPGKGRLPSAFLPSAEAWLRGSALRGLRPQRAGDGKGATAVPGLSPQAWGGCKRCHVCSFLTPPSIREPASVPFLANSNFRLPTT